ncbi:MAG: PstS family phosphate ABC transporter substrate-binding protein [Solirubrobacteraceae bacterium]|nr:PstS family phosphate ABC transporter substrate-binding protein [Solirubrobacteraceae bacterium]
MLKRLMIGAAVGALAVGVSACGSSDSSSTTSSVSGAVAIDGSSTVFPFAQAAAEGFQSENPDAKVTVGESGTGGGFEKFCAGEIDVADASRPIDDADEVPVCKENNVEYAQIEVANDGIAIVTNPALKMSCLTTDQLNQLWKKGSTVSDYNQLGSGVPAGKVSLFGPGTDSGTFDFFTEEINGEKGDTRTDYQPSEDDNVLVQGVQGDSTALGYFGFSYYETNADKLNLVAVDGGDGCIKPSVETIQNGTYKPLSRTIYMYVNAASLADKPQVKAFMDYVVANADESAKTAQIVPLTAEQLTTAKDDLSKAEGS